MLLHFLAFPPEPNGEEKIKVRVPDRRRNPEDSNLYRTLKSCYFEENKRQIKEVNVIGQKICDRFCWCSRWHTYSIWITRRRNLPIDDSVTFNCPFRNGPTSFPAFGYWGKWNPIQNKHIRVKGCKMVWDTIGAFGLGAFGPYQGIGFRAELRFKL